MISTQHLLALSQVTAWREAFWRAEGKVVVQMKLIKQLFDEINWSYDGIAEHMFGINASWPKQYLFVLWLHEDLQTFLDQGKIDLGAARTFSALPLNRQAEILKEFLRLKGEASLQNSREVQDFIKRRVPTVRSLFRMHQQLVNEEFSKRTCRLNLRQAKEFIARL